MAGNLKSMSVLYDVRTDVKIFCVEIVNKGRRRASVCNGWHCDCVVWRCTLNDLSACAVCQVSAVTPSPDFFFHSSVISGLSHEPPSPRLGWCWLRLR